jgi:DNA polymerase
LDILTCDFETFWDTDYTLSKMTTEEYIRDPRFEPIGVSVKLNDERPEWVSGTRYEVKEFLDEFPWDTSLGIAHNAMFDMAILDWHFDITPKMIGDTLSMARALDGPDAGHSLGALAERYDVGVKGNEAMQAKGKRRKDFTQAELAQYGAYCCNDSDLAYRLFTRMAPIFPPSEAQLVDLTIRMFTQPMLRLNKQVLSDHLLAVKTKKEALLATIDADKTDLMSNPKLAALLTEMGVIPPTKISPTTGKVTHAFAKSDTDFTDLLEHPDLRVQAVVAARLGVKSTLEETRTERFIGIAARGALPVPLNFYGAHTGRWSGADKTNMQNLPPGALKKAIEAPDGYLVLDCDSSQIEARTLAWWAGEDVLVETFRSNNLEIAAGVPKREMLHDPYRITAGEIYGLPLSDIADHHRQVGKTVILGCGYGLGAARLQVQLLAVGIKMDFDECQRIIDVYRAMYPRIPLLWRQGDRVLTALMQQQTTEFGRKDVLTVNLLGIGLPNGLHIRYRDLRRERNPTSQMDEVVYTAKRGRAEIRTKIYGAKVVENVTQALARIIVGEQMLEIDRRVPVVLTTHDSATTLTLTENAAANRAYVEACMRKVPAWAAGLPLNCESKMGPSYG